MACAPQSTADGGAAWAGHGPMLSDSLAELDPEARALSWADRADSGEPGESQLGPVHPTLEDPRPPLPAQPSFWASLKSPLLKI